MGDLQIECPLCCHKSFNSKQSLVEHLANVLNELCCPICNSKCSSLQEIILHLNQNDCNDAPNNSIQNIVIYENECNDNENSAANKSLKRLSDELSTQFITDQTFECQDDTGDVNKMYEFILKPHELKLIKEDGENRYLIVNQDEADLSSVGTIVTKQNNDGTVTLTSSKDIKEEIETLIIPEADLTTSQEMYNCNACKVSFTSVYDHIQNYHNDEEVVLEDTPSAIGPVNNQMSLDNDSQESEESSIDKQTARRVITDTGDIVEEQMTCKSEDAVTQEDSLDNDKVTEQPKVVLDKQGRAFTRRLVVLNKGSEAVKQEVTDNKTGKHDSYHKVVTKEVQTKDGVSVTVYQCMLCNVNVNDLNEFENHPCKVLKYPCPCCPAAYETSKSLCAHMKVHKETPDGVNRAPVSYECEVCSTVFLTNKSLKLHRRMHDPVKARPIEPPVANKDGSNLTGGVYRCNICNKMIPFDYRKIHENAHKTGDKMNCGICNKKFSSIEYLEMHMNVHNLDKVPVNNQDKSLPYECLYCTRRFARPHEKVKHERIHTGEKPHACEICGKSFRVSYCLTLHMRTHTGARPYACPHCGKRFKAHSVYNHHLLTHSEVRAYKCPYCPKAFKTSVQLAGHKNSHTKPFSCQQCNRPFASLYAVRIHTETHSRQNNLKFSCALCGASYARAFALKDHVKQVHCKQDEDGEELLNENNQQDDWMEKENTSDPEEMPTLNKDLQEDMTDLEMNANELIVP